MSIFSGAFICMKRKGRNTFFLILGMLPGLVLFQMASIAYAQSAEVKQEQEQTREQTQAQEGVIPDAPIVREQAAISEEPEAKQLPARKSFWSYVFRVMSAPVMILVNYPRDEEREVSQTYYEYVNDGTSRQWRGKEDKDIKPGHDIKYMQTEGGGKEKEEHATDAPHEADGTTTR